MPGKILSGTVKEIAMINLQGQLPPSGQVPMAPTEQDLPLPYGMIVEGAGEE